MFSPRQTLASASFLLLVLSFDQVAAHCEDSLICCSRTNEILIIAAIVAVCVFFLILCVVIVFLIWRISAFQKRLDDYSVRRGSLNFYNTYEMTSKNDVKEERESDVTGRGSDSQFEPGSVKRSSQYIHPIPIKHRSVSGEDSTVWGMY